MLSSQDACEREVSRSLAVRIDQLLEGSRKGDWQPAEPLPSSQSEWVNALLSAMQVHCVSNYYLELLVILFDRLH